MGVDVGVFGEGEFADGLFGGFAEEEADGGGFVGEFYLAVEVVHNHLHQAEVLVGEFVELEVDEDVTAEEAVVEDEIDEVVVVVEGEAPQMRPWVHVVEHSRPGCAGLLASRRQMTNCGQDDRCPAPAGRPCSIFSPGFDISFWVYPAPLAGFKVEAFAHLEEEVFEAVDDGLLEVALGVAGFFLKAEEF